MTTTEVGGAPAGAPDVTGPSSTPTTQTAAEPSRRERMEASVRQMREAASGPRDPKGRFARDPSAQQATDPAENDPAALRPPEAGESTTPEEPAEKPAAKSDDDNGEEPKQEPPWLRKRLDRERAKHTKEASALQGQLHQATLAKSQSDHALKMLAAELERVTLQLKEGRPYDPRDDEVRNLQLLEQSRQVKAQLQGEHQRALEQQQEAEADQEAAAALGQEIAEALAKHPLVSHAELVDAIRKDSRAATADLAVRIQAERLAKLRASGFVPASPAQAPPPAQTQRTPMTARTSSAAASVSFQNTREDREAYVRSLRGRT